MLSDLDIDYVEDTDLECLNVSIGARCFLTLPLNPPWGREDRVLMHLMALGAFWHLEDDALPRCRCEVLIYLMALGSF